MAVANPAIAGPATRLASFERYTSNTASHENDRVKRACICLMRANKAQSLSSPISTSTQLLSNVEHRYDDVTKEESLNCEAVRDAATDNCHHVNKSRLAQRECTTEEDDLRRIVSLQKEEKFHRERCARLSERIASYEKQHGKLLIEAERFRLAAEKNAAAIRKDRLAEEQEREWLKQNETELAEILSRLSHRTSNGDLN